MISLSDIKDNCWVRIEKIEFKDKSLINKLESIGIIESQEVFIENSYPIKDVVTLVINDVTYMLRRNNTTKILVSYI